MTRKIIQRSKWLNRGERSETYLTNVWRLLWSIVSLGKIERKQEHSASLQMMEAIVLAEYSCFPLVFLRTQDSLHSVAVCRHESSGCHSFLPYLATFFYFTFPGFPFTLRSVKGLTKGGIPPNTYSR